MSRIDNEFRLSGRLVAAVEVKHNQVNQNPIGKFRLAVNDGYYDNQNQWVERTTFLDLTTYNKWVVDRLQKQVVGQELHVLGSLKKSSWESKTRFKDDGTPEYDSRVELIVDEMRVGRTPRPKESQEATHDGQDAAQGAQGAEAPEAPEAA